MVHPHRDSGDRIAKTIIGVKLAEFVTHGMNEL
jgi:hypothetical protein